MALFDLTLLIKHVTPIYGSHGTWSSSSPCSFLHSSMAGCIFIHCQRRPESSKERKPQSLTLPLSQLLLSTWSSSQTYLASDLMFQAPQISSGHSPAYVNSFQEHHSLPAIRLLLIIFSTPPQSIHCRSLPRSIGWVYHVILENSYTWVLVATLSKLGC